MLNPQDIKLLVVHCSNTPDKQHIGASEIHKMHLSFGWDGIGYHKIIRRDGQIESGRPEFWIGAHVYGKNDQSLGVCLIGTDYFTNKQYSALYKVLSNWKRKFPTASIKGHRETIKTEKTCPNFDVQKWCIKRNLV